MVSDGFQTCLPMSPSPPLKPLAVLCLVLTMQAGMAQTVCSRISPRQGKGSEFVAGYLLHQKYLYSEVSELEECC